jgi:membrane-bound serine protease (ClpP class)
MLAGALFILFSLPTNWLALLLIITGILGFILIPFFSLKFAPVAISGLVLQGAGSFFLFDGVGVSPMVIAFTLALSQAYHQIVLTPTLRRLQAVNEQPIEREDRMIGLRGRVTRVLDPIGTVQVDSELWTATSHDHLEVGTPIVVVGREGLSLLVEPLKRKEEQSSTDTQFANGH